MDKRKNPAAKAVRAKGVPKAVKGKGVSKYVKTKRVPNAVKGRGPAQNDSFDDFPATIKIMTEWTHEELYRVPSMEEVVFGEYTLDRDYRESMESFYNCVDVVGTYLGHNPDYPSQETWLERRRWGSDSESIDSDEEGSDAESIDSDEEEFEKEFVNWCTSGD
jgi:hypothetical protein